MAKRPAAAMDAAVAVGAAVLQGAAVRRRLRGKRPAENYMDLPHAAPMEEEPLQRPAAKLRRPAAKPEAASANLCHGRPGVPCIFSTAEVGARARYQASTKQCPWCNEGQMTQAMGSQIGRRNSCDLRFFWRNGQDIFTAAVARLPQRRQKHFPLQSLGLSPAFHSPEALQQAVKSASGRGRLLSVLRRKQPSEPELVKMAIQVLPEELQDEMQTKAATEPRRVLKERRRDSLMDQWEAAMAARRSIRARPTEAMEAEYLGRVKEDRARVRRKFFPEHDRQVKHSGHSWSNPMTEPLLKTVQDLQSNDAGLPAAQQSPLAGMLEQWCHVGSWAVCKSCHSLEPRHLKEIDTRRTATPLVDTCRWCRGADGRRLQRRGLLEEEEEDAEDVGRGSVRRLQAASLRL